MKPISFDNYYWQNELVRLRASTYEDWEVTYPDLFDSPARFLLQERVELPPVVADWQEKSRQWAGFGSQKEGMLMFTIETLDGTTVGAVNLRNIDERDGTFSAGMQIDVGQRGKGYGTAALRLILKYAFLERACTSSTAAASRGTPPRLRFIRKWAAYKRACGDRSTITTDATSTTSSSASPKTSSWKTSGGSPGTRPETPFPI